MTANAWHDRWFSSSDGLRLYYRDFPAPGSDRAPVLCLPGLTRNSRDFESTALRLRSTRRVLCADLRGRGRSQHDPQWRNYHLVTYLGDIALLLRDAGAERVVLLGTSLGGILSMMLATTTPDVPVGVILNDIGPEVSPAGLARIASYVGRNTPVGTWDEAVAQARATYGVSMPEASDAEWIAFARRSYTDVDGVPRLDMDPMIGEAFRAAPAGAAPDLWPVYSSLRPIPTLALRGALSDVLSVETFERMAHEKPDLRRLTVTGRGHPPLLDEPECIVAIDDFLATVP